jgi:hypothetical protein
MILFYFYGNQYFKRFYRNLPLSLFFVPLCLRVRTKPFKIAKNRVVYAGRGLYYQAQTRMLDSVLKEIPTLELDGDNLVALKMQTGGGCAPPHVCTPREITRMFGGR